MVLTRLEKLSFALLVLLLLMGVLFLIIRIRTASDKNDVIMRQIAMVAAYTDYNPLQKDYTIDPGQAANKLNLNRADLRSIEALPGVSKAMAKSIYNLIKAKGEISNLSELTAIKGINNKRLRQLEQHVTTVGGHAGQAAWGSKINLNFATEADLSSLPGIGKSTAKKIIEFRNNNASLRSLEELKEIPGISAKVLNTLKEWVEVH